MSGKTVIYVKPEGSTECLAKIRVDTEIEGLGKRHLELVCCLWAPHPLYRHMNPRVQATIGGDRWTDDPQWSYYLEKLPEGKLDHYSPRLESERRNTKDELGQVSIAVEVEILRVWAKKIRELTKEYIGSGTAPEIKQFNRLASQIESYIPS